MFMQLRLQKIEHGLDDKMKRQFEELKHHVSLTVSQQFGGWSQRPPVQSAPGMGAAQVDPVSAAMFDGEEGVQRVPATNRPYMAGPQGAPTRSFVREASHGAAPPHSAALPAAKGQSPRPQLGDASRDAPARIPARGASAASALTEELRATRLSLERRLDAVAEEVLASCSRLCGQQLALAEALSSATRSHADEAIALAPAALEATIRVAVQPCVGEETSGAGDAAARSAGSSPPRRHDVGGSADAWEAARITGRTRCCDV